MGSITTRGSAALAAGIALGVLGCARPHVSPLAPPPFRAEIRASYDATWKAVVRTLAQQNVPLRAIARDSGVIASDDFVTPIGVYADCGTLGSDRIEGEALVSFTLFLQGDDEHTALQINSQMRTFNQRKGSSGKLKPTPIYQCASTTRFEANLVDTVRDLARK